MLTKITGLAQPVIRCAKRRNVRSWQLQNNDPKSENKALKERAAKTKDVEGRLKGMGREHARPRENMSVVSRKKVGKPAR
jgi:hypothetical protein